MHGKLEIRWTVGGMAIEFDSSIKQLPSRDDSIFAERLLSSWARSRTGEVMFSLCMRCVGIGIVFKEGQL